MLGRERNRTQTIDNRDTALGHSSVKWFIYHYYEALCILIIMHLYTI